MIGRRVLMEKAPAEYVICSVGVTNRFRLCFHASVVAAGLHQCSVLAKEDLMQGSPYLCFTPIGTEDRDSIWLPTAPTCNVICSPCGRRGDRRTIPSIVLSPDEALERVAAAIERGAMVPEVLLWGPGETLLSAATFVVLRRLAWLYPDLPVTVCTNGLLLSDRLDELVRASVRNVQLSIPALMPQTAAKFYDSAVYRARRYTGEAAATLVLQQQWSGLLNAVEAGISVTVSIIEIPGVNEHEIPLISHRARDLGAERVIVSAMSRSASSKLS